MDKYNVNNTIVITISSVSTSEVDFLKKCTYDNNEIQNSEWIYGLTNGENFHSHTNNNMNDFSFVLINPTKWVNKAKEVLTIINIMSKAMKKIIIWTHSSDNFLCDQIREDITFNLCNPFHHERYNSIIEKFMKNISEGENYLSEFNALIQESLKRKHSPYLITLFILCQGYLAAHGEISLPDNFGELKGIVKSKAGITENVNWWLPVISGNTKIARDELGNRNNKKVVEDLLDAIDGKDGKTLSGSDGIKIVESAYRILPEILQGPL